MRERIEFLLPEVVRAMEENCGFSESNALFQARHLLEVMPDELLPNLYEWVSGESLSDLRVGKYSILMIIKIWNMDEKKDFPIAAETMSLYVRDPRAGERRIWRLWR